MIAVNSLRGQRVLQVAGVTGLEPAASGVTGRRSNQLSYTPGRPSQSGRRHVLHGPSGVKLPRAARTVLFFTIFHGFAAARVLHWQRAPPWCRKSGGVVGDDGVEPPTFSV